MWGKSLRGKEAHLVMFLRQRKSSKTGKVFQSDANSIEIVGGDIV